MDYLTLAFSRITSWFNEPRNLSYLGTYEHEPPRTAYTNPIAFDNHQKTLLYSFEKYLYPNEIDYIVNQHRRSDVTMEAILHDFFMNDVEQHAMPFDIHVENGLKALDLAFRPPKPCLPAHIYDVQHHYPYKWQVNSEPPFSTDRFFKENLPTFEDFLNANGPIHIDVDDFNRRYPDQSNPSFLATKVPPKFGFQKNTIFNWTHRWHHVIKSGFTDLGGLDPNSYYVKHRFIFPMLLHTKTAIVKKDDPDKMRTIWGCSKPWIIADTMFYWEYIAWIKSNPGSTPMLWGYETFTGGWLRLNAELFHNHMKSSYLTLDWSRFDKRAYFTLIHKIMATVRTFLDFDNGYLPTKDYPDTQSTWTPDRALKLHRLWEWTLECLYKSAIVLPNGEMYTRNFAGIPSGLYITQLLDSWYNYTMIATLLSSLGITPSDCIIKVQGDDSIVKLATLIPPGLHDVFLSKMQENADRYFKAIISVEKSELRNELNGCEVLSYRHRHGLPYRDEIKMLAQFFHTKSRDPTPQITMAQCIGFAYASCGNHKRVLMVLEDVYNYYASQGFSPNRAGLTAIFGNSPDILDFPFTLDHFPEESEIKAFLLRTHYVNPVQAAKTWPDHFVHKPCQRS
jgi:hypothetical protein